MIRFWMVVGALVALSGVGCAEEEQAAAVPYSAFQGVDPATLGNDQQGGTSEGGGGPVVPRDDVSITPTPDAAGERVLPMRTPRQKMQRSRTPPHPSVCLGGGLR